MTTFNCSFGDKLSLAYYLSLALGYVDDCVTVRDTEALFGAETSDDIWAWADGLVAKYHESRQSGRCSLQATIDYDIAEEEKRLDATIAKFQELIRKYNLPVHPDLMLTPKEEP